MLQAHVSAQRGVIESIRRNCGEYIFDSGYQLKVQQSLDEDFKM
jgi:hypothetical protein